MFMGLTSPQVCMDSSCSSDWLQGTMQEDSSSPSGEMLTCSRPPMMERRLRPQHEQALKCPRCDSTHTKFCYYNNYSLSQPRYFCKTCRRYWTKGGTLRNIPVGGGCRKNKKLSSKKTADVVHPQSLPSNHLGNTNPAAADLHLSFPRDDTQMPPPHFNNLLAAANAFVPLDFMDTKLEALVGNSSCNYDFMGGGFGSDHMPPDFHGFCSPYVVGMPLDGGSASNFTERIMLPYDAGDQDQVNAIDVKPNPKVLSLEWHDHSCSDAGKDGTLGYSLNNVGSWTGMINGYGTPTSNPLV